MLASACAVALLLLTDVSGSMSESRYTLQMKGTADAIESPELNAAYHNGVAISLVEFAGVVDQHIAVPWTIIHSHDEAVQFANRIRSIEGEGRGTTAIGSALDFAIDYLSQSPCGERKIIDISGDGSTNAGPPTDLARNTAQEKGYVINGLPIIGNEENIESYYREHIVTEGGFVITAPNDDDETTFVNAMRRKLLFELSMK